LYLTAWNQIYEMDPVFTYLHPAMGVDTAQNITTATKVIADFIFTALILRTVGGF
jgi:hypothetical protein